MHKLAVMRRRKSDEELSHDYRVKMIRLREIARKERINATKNLKINFVQNSSDSVSLCPLERENMLDPVDDNNCANLVIPPTNSFLKPSDTPTVRNALDPPDLQYEGHASNLIDPPSDSDALFNTAHALNDPIGWEIPRDVLQIANIDNFSQTDKLKRDLASVFVETGMSHRQINGVLRVLHPHFINLPIDARTIRQTPRTSCQLSRIAGGEYLHIGITESITSYLKNIPFNSIPPNLLMDSSTDGAILDAQGKIQMWPIQIRIVNLLTFSPDIVGIWRGSSKPSDVSAFFKSFVDEFLEIFHRGGILFHNKLFPLQIRSFIADAPARALVLSHHGHNSYYRCSKCWIKGEYVRPSVSQVCQFFAVVVHYFLYQWGLFLKFPLSTCTVYVSAL